MDLLEALDQLADGDDLHVWPEMRAHICDRFDTACRFERFDGDFAEFCSIWADNIRGEQHDDEQRHRGWEAA